MDKNRNLLAPIFFFRRINFRRRYLFFALIAILLFCGGAASFYLHRAAAQEAQTAKAQKRILPLRVTESPSGAQISIISDTPLTDYTASRSGDRYYVVIPQADASAVEAMRVRGLEGMQVQKRGNDLVLTFHLRPNASAHINPRFNRLDVLITSPNTGTERAVEGAVAKGVASNASNSGATTHGAANLANNSSRPAKAQTSPGKANEAANSSEQPRISSNNPTEKTNAAAIPAPSVAPSVNTPTTNGAATSSVSPAPSPSAQSNLANTNPATANSATPSAAVQRPVVVSTPNAAANRSGGRGLDRFLQRNWWWILALMFAAAVIIIYLILRPVFKERAERKKRRMKPQTSVWLPKAVKYQKNPDAIENKQTFQAPTKESEQKIEPAIPVAALASQVHPSSPKEDAKERANTSSFANDPFAVAAARMEQTSAPPEPERVSSISDHRLESPVSLNTAPRDSFKDQPEMTNAPVEASPLDEIAAESDAILEIPDSEFLSDTAPAHFARENFVEQPPETEPPRDAFDELNLDFFASDESAAEEAAKAEADSLPLRTEGAWHIPIIAVPQFDVSHEAIVRFERRMAERRKGDRRKGDRRKGDRRQSQRVTEANSYIEEPRAEEMPLSAGQPLEPDAKELPLTDELPLSNEQELPAFNLAENPEFDDALLTTTKPSPVAPAESEAQIPALVAESPALTEAVEPEPTAETQAEEGIESIELIQDFENDEEARAPESVEFGDLLGDVLEVEPSIVGFAEPVDYKVIKRERAERTSEAESTAQTVSPTALEEEAAKAVARDEETAPEMQTGAEAKSIEISNGEAATGNLASGESSEKDSQAKTKEEMAARVAYISQLSLLDTEDAFKAIGEAFDDPTPEVRTAAARALNRLNANRADAFTRALREASPERRRNIGRAIAESGLADEAIDRLNNAGREKTYDAFSLLFLMAKAGELEPLIRAVETHHDKEIRMAVIKLLALSGQPDALPPLRRLAVRGSLPSDIRSAIMEAIYQLGASQIATAGTTRIA